eukprot:789041-Rhodomonas_salina.1
MTIRSCASASHHDTLLESTWPIMIAILSASLNGHAQTQSRTCTRCTPSARSACTLRLPVIRARAFQVAVGCAVTVSDWRGLGTVTDYTSSSSLRLTTCRFPRVDRCRSESEVASVQARERRAVICHVTTLGHVRD